MSNSTQEPKETGPGFGAGAFFLFWAALGWYGLISNSPIWSTLGAPGLDPGPAILPVFACTALTLGGLWCFAIGLARANAGVSHDFLRTILTPIVFLATALVMASVLDLIGFRLAGFCFALVWLFTFGRRDKGLLRRLLIALVLAAAITAFIEIIFVQLLRVPLP